ncbi:MAG TPA: acetylornithine deacetylase/succinyl-diaminopimelate desuccinylase family protein [Blastocatellia bacterium]|nr:acetylornithine deacetylase/succinyl-diaminopimelate desuccinylase family protein [Blastocatellia bacterium]
MALAPQNESAATHAKINESGKARRTPNKAVTLKQMTTPEHQVLGRVDQLTDEMIEWLRQLVRIPTINPPGENYKDCAHFVGNTLKEFGYEVSFIEADGRPECSPEHPRLNVIGHLNGSRFHPTLHFNGHIDVVPPGAGWTLDPFAAEVRDKRIYGRGVTDQKAGIAASVFAIEAIRRAGVKLAGSVEQSATVDEESGGFAGVAYLAEHGYVRPDLVDYVIITEPLDYDRICLGHRGVYWFEVLMHGRIAHGSMPFLGVSAIDRMARLIERVERELKPKLAERRTRMPVEPAGARSATINVNAITGGQDPDAPQSPCVADLCRAVFDRRFLIEEKLEDARQEFISLIEQLRADDEELQYELKDLMIVHPTMTEPDAQLVRTMRDVVSETTGHQAPLIASPGTYDQKHFSRLAGIKQCIAYGPGILKLAHQPDEYCEIDHLVSACKAMSIGAMRLIGV